MDAGHVRSPAALDALAVATGAMALDADRPTPATTAAPLLARESLVERLLGTPPTAADPSNAPARHVEHGAETGSVQTQARSDAAAPAPREAPARTGDPAPTGAAQAGGEHALAADQLVPATLIGLHAQPAWTLALPLPPMPHFAPAEDEPAATRRDPGRDGDAGDRDEDDDADGEDLDDPLAADLDGAGDDASGAPRPDADAVLDPADDEACAAVARALQAWLAAPSRGGLGAAAALSALLDQWQRGRCVVVACPQGPGADAAAWAFVLRSRRPAICPPDGRRADLHPADPRRRLAVVGRRVAARLQWRAAPSLGVQWVHARLAKDHHPQRGRQLVPMGAVPGAATPCTVQLGPVLAERRTPSDVHLRVDAVRRFWSALGDQWSVLVVACSLPLAARMSHAPHAPPVPHVDAMEDRHAYRRP